MIGIIGFESLHVMQYLKKYTKVLDEKNIEYEVVYWNRNGAGNPADHFYPYNQTINTYIPFRRKILHFLGYTRFVYQTINKRKYDRLIVLTTQTAIVLSPILLMKYRKRYLYDYRDITFERNPLYLFLVKKMFHQSLGVAISSYGFTKTLGKSSHYLLSHNCHDFEFNHITKEPSETIRIVYWGMVRQPAFNKKICDLFGNDHNFTLTYHGEGFYKEIESYCKSRGYHNISFTGEYQPTEIEQFAKNTDILLNAYENDHQQQPALTVKLYDGMRYRLPMLVTSESYMAEYLKNNVNIYALSLDNIDAKAEIIQWFESLSQEQINLEYQQLQQELITDEEKFIKLVEDFEKSSEPSLKANFF